MGTVSLEVEKMCAVWKISDSRGTENFGSEFDDVVCFGADYLVFSISG